jgi:hypothetical protein
MKTQVNTLLLTAILTIPAYAVAYELTPANSHESLCYGRAMIGYDSVINARLGVPAEHALNLALLGRPPTTAGTVYSKAMLTTIWDAYLWQETPHSYALKVFYRCAAEQTTLHSARNDWIITENY